MATAAERGFAFKDLPTVIDPASDIIEVKLVPYRPPGEAPDDDPVSFAAYHKLAFPHDALWIVRTLHLANIYADQANYEKAERALAYGATGVLRAVLYRDAARDWIIERMPEEFTGEHTPAPSVRFLFPDSKTAQQVAELAGKLQTGIRLGNHYEGIQADAQQLLNLIVGKGSEPRFVEVADPIQRRQF
jgi:hypothetical protein